MTTIQIELEQFRIAYDSVRVSVYDDFMVYSTPSGMADIMARSANRLIQDLDLNLTAIPAKNYPADTFVVKSNYTIDI